MQAQPAPGKGAHLALLAVTIIGTMSNNIVNVPLRQIAADFDEPVSYAVLCVSAFTLMLAITLPLTGWLGDRFGRRRVLLLALGVMAGGQVAAALAPSLPFLIVTRGIQGLGCSAIPPLVMGILILIYPEQRGRMMASWATANGVGQAIGPPIGGVVSDLTGWRSIFVLVAVLVVAVAAVIARQVPELPPQPNRLHLPGAVLLTSGVGLVLVGVTLLSQPTIPKWVDAGAIILGLLLLAGFAGVSHGNSRAMIPLRLIVEVRFLRSSFAAFAQMFMLGTALVAGPLFLTGPLGLSYSQAGLFFFVLPVAMAVMAPFVGRACDQWVPRYVLRIGLLAIVLSGSAMAWTATADEPSLWLALVALLAIGMSMAMVQTPAATGATRSPAGAYGAALGLFNLTRFAGMTAGAAWVALLAAGGRTPTIFLGAAVISLVSLLLSYLGDNPSAEQPAEAQPASIV